MHDPVAPLLIRLAILLGAAKLAGWLAVRARQPAVLGEILIGIALGNLGLLGIHALEPIATDRSLDLALIRIALEKPGAPSADIVALADTSVGRTSQAPELAGEAHFLLGSVYGAAMAIV
jgi:hypothetical protein